MASPFKSLGEALKKPQVHWPIAVVLLGLLVGGIGYLLLGRVLDAVVIGLAVAIIGLMTVVLRAVFAWEREDRLSRGTEAPGTAGASAGEAPAGGSMEDSVRRAVAEIRGSRLGAGGLDALPWILLLGEIGEGKTAAVRESGLALPAEYASRVTGAPTRDCDWWLTNEAILLDLAGRFFACADEATHDEWRSLLKQLRRQRPGCALNGVVFAISVDSLLGRSAAEQEEAARSLRLRLNELTDELGVDLPVYVVVTKVDHVEGFVECVNASPVILPGNALGWSNDQRHLANAEDRVNEAFADILARIESVLPELILRDPDRVRRRRIHAFPQELEEVVSAAARFIGRAFAPSSYDSAPYLRGVYLTSARREGATISPQLHRLGRDDARNRVDGSLAAGGIFLRDLFHEIVIGDRDLALAAERFGPRARRVVHLAAGFVFLLLAGWWGVAFVSNLTGILQLRREAATVVAGASSLASLESTRLAIRAHQEDLGVLRRGGLGGPMQTALAHARVSFAWGFGREFEAPTKLKLQSVVRGFDDGAFEALAQLAADVTWLSSRADANASPRPDLARYAPISASTSDAAALRDGYDDFVRWSSHDEIQDRIDRERKVVAAGSARLLELRRLETWSQSSSSYPPARYGDVGLPAGEPSSGEVPGAYTRRGWDGLVAGLIEAIDSTGPASSVVKQFREGYVTRYESNWRGYLMGAPTPVRSSADVKSSPYLQLIEQIHTNASVGLPRVGPAPAWLLALAEARRSEPLPEEQTAADKQGTGDAKGGQAPPPPDPPWKRYQLALDQVASDVQAAEEDPAAAVEIAKDLATRKPTNFVKALKLVVEVVPAEGDPEAAEKIRRLLSMPILDGASAVLGRALDELDGRWAARIARPFAGNLSGPVMAGLYGGQGELAKFRSGELAPFYLDGRAVEVIGDRSMPLGRGFLAWMRAAERVQRSLFPGGVGGGVKVAARLQGVPSRVSGREQVRVSQRELRLRCADQVQTFGYREGTAEYTFQWSPDCTELTLRIFGVEGGRERELLPKREWTGPMAFPSFLQQASRSGSTLQWTIRFEDPDLAVLMAYRLRGGEELLSLSHAAPPGSMRN